MVANRASSGRISAGRISLISALITALSTTAQTLVGMVTARRLGLLLFRKLDPSLDLFDGVLREFQGLPAMAAFFMRSHV